MADTFTSGLGFDQPQVNSDNGIWGNILNTDLQAIDDAVSGIIAINVAGLTNFTLPAVQGQSGANYAARFSKWTFQGALTATCTVTIPGTAAGHGYLENQTTGAHNIVLAQGTAGSNITVPVGTGAWQWWASDGTSVSQQSLGVGGLSFAGTSTGAGFVVTNNLAVQGAGTAFNVTNSGSVGGNLTVTGTLSAGTINASGTTTSLTASTLSVTGTGNAFSVTNSGSFGGTATAATLAVTGTSTHSGAAFFAGAVSLTGTGNTLQVTNGGTFGGTATAAALSVTGNAGMGTSSVSGTATIGALAVTGTSTHAGAATFAGNVAMGTASVSGTATAAALSVTGNAGMGTSSVSGTATVATELIMGNGATSPIVFMQGNGSTVQPRITYANTGAARWTIIQGNTETGLNVGSDLICQAFADDGVTLLSLPLALRRSDGLATFGKDISVQGTGTMSGGVLQIGTNTAPATNNVNGAAFTNAGRSEMSRIGLGAGNNVFLINASAGTAGDYLEHLRFTYGATKVGAIASNGTNLAFVSGTSTQPTADNITGVAIGLVPGASVLAEICTTVAGTTGINMSTPTTGAYIGFINHGLNGTNTSIGSITNLGGTQASFNGVLNGTSDHRLKSVLGVATGDLIDSLRVYDACWNSDPEQNVYPMVIAHEVQEVAPWFVVGKKDEVDENGTIVPQRVNHTGFIPALIAHNQALKQRVASLEGRVAALEGSR